MDGELLQQAAAVASCYSLLLGFIMCSEQWSEISQQEAENTLARVEHWLYCQKEDGDE